MPENATNVTTKASVLGSVKKMLGLAEDFDAFDLDVIIHINSAFSTLYQAGVGPVSGFSIEDANDTWDRFIGNKMTINDVKTYVYLRVRLLFDPPSTSFALKAVEDQITELLWRLNVADDSSFRHVPSVTGYWDLTGGIDFPEEAEIGDKGIDKDTGDIWEKTGG